MVALAQKVKRERGGHKEKKELRVEGENEGQQGLWVHQDHLDMFPLALQQYPKHLSILIKAKKKDLRAEQFTPDGELEAA